MPKVMADQIAAGEVVARPASCVKELVENSLDAGATRIEVALAEGGIACVTVVDDGEGMSAEDAALAFHRHATSKVHEPRDLARIRTLGFRGEALAAIASVARVRLITRARGEESGVLVRVEGGHIHPPEPIGAPFGTTMEVRDLFFNTPARLKYLRSAHTEQARSVEVVQRESLAHPEVAFVCRTERQVLFQTPGRGDAREVWAALYGVGEARMLLEARGATDDYTLHGYVGRPTQARSSRQHGYLFINGRPVRNLVVQQAVERAYGERLMVGRYPVYALYLEMDPALVDPNVHPQKWEVRLSEERDVCQLVESAVREALDNAMLTASPRVRTSAPIGSPVPLKLPEEPERLPEVPERTREMQQSPSPGADPKEPPRHLARSLSFGQGTGRTAAPREVWESALAVRESAASQLEAEPKTEANHAEDKREVQQERPTDWRLRPIGQALRAYILAEDGNDLYIIDQHAAHERVLYEDLLDAWEHGDIQPMPLLTPLELSLRPSVFEEVMACREELLALGIEIDPFGAHTVLVRTIPDSWQGLDYAALLRDALDDLASMGAKATAPDIMHRLATRACKAAVKAHDVLTMPEMEALCRRLTRARDPYHCPHGRPVFLRMTERELARSFRRIV
ncbi:DNA mismatch repair endonuclease MutL [Alicyclobacillus acidocaldarius]|uniref:DNA mismatch repair protein MutL n=1 Tax=Alicyclobacillus acidocaldarius (strain Tc-4-1) TaxID=1048834 RepID=F8IIN2_ALIAT|nr:DNA mismatch repair endonuclease MutL [Alicyclobacillus acidocaldarius]AEJ43364.1 DNA mismatch repair protein MutL [Alicyclobacillus acidocaldarius subsp. acidocaldarius Tc-4-1]